jgi:hypothetical protein
MEVRAMSLKGRRKQPRRKPGSHIDRYADLAAKARQASEVDQMRWERKAAETAPAPTDEVDSTESATE